MDVQLYLEKLSKLQSNILNYLDNNEDIEENLDNLNNIIFDEIKAHDNIHELRLIMHLITKIANNFHRETNFFEKIENILQLFKEKMQKHLSNSQIFNIFKSNKRILLFLIEENILTFDKNILKKLICSKYIKAKYLHFFSPEIKQFVNDNFFHQCVFKILFIKSDEFIKEIKRELPEKFYENRKIGENENYICHLIRKDLIKEFIIYVNKNFCTLKSSIIPSIYETNSFLLKQENIALIEYAAFFGSIQIFNYLRLNEVELTPSLWRYAIHGQNPEIIHLLEENNIKPINNNENEYYKELLKESIKCHHIGISNYIQDNYLQNNKEDSDFALEVCLKYYNFNFKQFDLINEFSFCYLCKYDYYMLVYNLLKEIDIDVNMRIQCMKNI